MSMLLVRAVAHTCSGHIPLLLRLLQQMALSTGSATEGRFRLMVALKAEAKGQSHPEGVEGVGGGDQSDQWLWRSDGQVSEGDVTEN